MLDRDVFERRRDAVCIKLREDGTDCMLLVPSSYMKYMTGYAIRGDERLLTAVYSPDREPFFFANALYQDQVTETPVSDFVYWKDGEDAVPALLRALSERGIRTGCVAVNPGCPASYLLPLMNTQKGCRWIDAAPYMDEMRLYKDESEQKNLVKACEKADEALRKTMARGRQWLGHTEEEVLAALVYEMTCLGIKNGAACVCAGESAAVPHHHPGDRIIREGDCLLIDFGGDYENYNTDMTRNFYFGEPGEEYRHAYEVVLEALSRGKGAALAGNTMQDVDRAVRGYITEQGYGPWFVHRTGHGIGLDCHEGPSVMEGEKAVICPGMVFSCEPGIYLPGKFGVRIEDELMVTEDGVKALHHAPLELQIFRRGHTVL